MKKAKERKFCGHSVDGLKEANCNPDVRSARSIVDQHRIPADEFFQVCDSNLQEEVKSLLTNHIIAPMENVLCVSCGVIRDFHGDPTELCTACNTSHRTSISMLIAVPVPAVKCPVNKVRSITCYTTDNDEDKKVWLTNLINSIITPLQAVNEIKLEMFLTGGDVNCHLLDILRSLTTERQNN